MVYVKSQKISKIARGSVMFVSVLLPAVAIAASFSVGSVGTVPGLIPNPANGYNGQYLGTSSVYRLIAASRRIP